MGRMKAPSVRGVAVVAGFLGVTMVVAGAAAAMTTESTDEPVATAVTLTHDDPSTRDVTAEAPPATAAEVRARPIECSAEGDCGREDDDGEVQHEAPAASTEPPPPAPQAPAETHTPASPSEDSTAAAADCDYPPPPAWPADGDREAWRAAVGAWLEQAAASTQGCERAPLDWKREWEDWSGDPQEPRDSDAWDRPGDHGWPDGDHRWDGSAHRKPGLDEPRDRWDKQDR